jgi:histidine ammonia-lyase
MKKLLLSLVAVAACAPATFLNAEVTLDGHSATPEQIAAIAGGESVKIAPDAMKRSEDAFRVLCKAAGEGQMIYGLTVGVGLNKDRKFVDAKGELTQEVIDASSKFQTGLIRAHSGSVGPDMDIPTARATMAARLNMMLVGGAAVQIPVIDAYVSFLNKGVTPCMPNNGSMGEADITICSHVGQAMIGEGEVYYKGKKVPAADALKAIGMKPVKLFGKDALAILSSNAYSVGMGCLALTDMAQFQKINTIAFALSIQGLNGNVSPFLEDTLALHPFPETVKAGAEIRGLLQGSSIWNRDDNRRLQDPLSYRDSVFTIGEVNRAYEAARFLFTVQLNSSDDNPGVAVNVTAKSGRYQEMKSYVTTSNGSGAVLPSANFEPLPWVIAFEQLGIAMAHNSITSALRTTKLGTPDFTEGLERYLGTPKSYHAFGAMEKPPVTLAMENKVLSMPVSCDFLPVAGQVEDVATNAPLVVERLHQQIDNSFWLLGIEMIHAAQAVDLRHQKTPDYQLSPATLKLYQAIRAKVPMLDEDRSYTPDFRAANEVMRTFHE